MKPETEEETTMQRFQKVGVLMGGLSTEFDISMKSGRAVAEALRARGWDVEEIVVGRDLPQRLVETGVGAVWIALHGRFGEDGAVQGLLEVMGIPYTGSDVRASAVAMDKIATKRALADLPDLVFAEDAVVRRGDVVPQIPLPAVVKRPLGGSTIGITMVSTREELERAVSDALGMDEEVLIEQFVTGEEITVAVLDGMPLPVVRIIPESGFFDFEAKYTKGRTVYEVPAELPAPVTEHASRAAAVAFRELGCRGLARADFIVTPSGTPVFLEINTIPGMTATSLSPMAAGAVGISFEELVERLLLSARCIPAEVERSAASVDVDIASSAK